MTGNFILPIPASSPSGAGGHCAYGTTKAALNYFAKAVSRQEVGKGIRINILSPGAVATPILTPIINMLMSGKKERDETL